MKEEYMDIAFEEAKIAFDNDEVPIGVVIVKDDKIIAKAHNNKNSDNLVTSHDFDDMTFTKLKDMFNDVKDVDPETRKRFFEMVKVLFIRGE